MSSAPPTIRLQKLIARSGITSRRKAEELIRHGQVTVNGQTVMTLGTKIDPAQDCLTIDRHLSMPDHQSSAGSKPSRLRY